MTIVAEHNTLSDTCSVGLVHNFMHSEYNNGHYYRSLIGSRNPGGTGFLIAGFVVGNALSEEAFAALSDKHKVLFVSEPRHNVNSGNECYMAVFDTSESDIPTGFDECDREDDN